MSDHESALAPLVELGLNRLEAEVYVALLGEPGATGYRLGQRLGKPSANVYKALASLAVKGAAMGVDGESRSYRAVPAELFLRQLRADVARKVERAAAALARLEPVDGDGRVYHLEAAQLTIERAREMLDRAEASAVLDAFPHALDAVLPELQRAADRGVRLHVQVYAPVAIAGATVTLAAEYEAILEAFAGEQLNLVIDGREALLALLERDLERVREAVWSRSRYLAFLLQVGLTREHHAHALLRAPPDEAYARIQALLPHARHFTPDTMPGLTALLAKPARTGAQEETP